jgi:hypothetical protein
MRRRRWPTWAGHLGIARASAYATFGGKHELCLRTLDRYVQARDPGPVEMSGDTLTRPTTAQTTGPLSFARVRSDVSREVLPRPRQLDANLIRQAPPEQRVQ